MNIKKILTLLMALQSFCGLVLAGDVEGHGGGGIVCKDSNGSIISVEALDWKEAQELYTELKPYLGNPSLTVDEKVALGLSRLTMVDKDRQIRWGTYAKNFMAEARFVANSSLPLIEDIGTKLILPKNCKIRQIVIHKDPVLPLQKRYTINKDLWDKMDNDNKATLILHELIFRDLVSSGQKTSELARYYNAFLLDEVALTSMDQKTYLGFIHKLGFSFSYEGVPLILESSPYSLNFYSSGKVKSGSNPGLTLPVFVPVGRNVFPLPLNRKGRHYFYESGSLQVLQVETKSETMVINGKYSVFLPQAANDIFFHENTNIAGIAFVKNQTLMIRGKKLKTSEWGSIRFHPSTSIHCLENSDDVELFNTNGKIEIFPKGTIWFDENEGAYRDPNQTRCQSQWPR
jgi:hypothetical protein